MAVAKLISLINSVTIIYVFQCKDVFGNDMHIDTGTVLCMVSTLVVVA